MSKHCKNSKRHIDKYNCQYKKWQIQEMHAKTTVINYMQTPKENKMPKTNIGTYHWTVKIGE